MARFGGNQLDRFTVPIAFGGRFFLLEGDDPPLFTVLAMRGEEGVYEVVKNAPGEGGASDVARTASGGVAVRDRESGALVYEIAPGTPTRIRFHLPGGGTVDAEIRDDAVCVGGITVSQGAFGGPAVMLAVGEGGGVSMGVPLPRPVLAILQRQATAN